jgi:hypothetical protein
MVGIVVVVTGGYIIWKLVEFCKEYFPDPPPPIVLPPNPSASNVTFSAAWFLQSEPGPQIAPSPKSGMTEPPGSDCSFTFTLLFANGRAILTNAFVPGSETLAAFQQQLVSYGITNTSETSHPLNIVQDGAVISVLGDDIRTVVIERLAGGSWTPIQTNSFPASMKLQATVSGPCSNAFYRVKQL